MIPVLIPKVAQPQDFSQFRSISLCNVSYKIIIKVIVNRLKKIMIGLISPHQPSFVPERQIKDNIIVAQKILHTMRKMRKI